MTLYPDIQARGRQEIFRVLGTGDRLPAFSDDKSIPYIDAIIKEVLRWRPVTPMGMRFFFIYVASH